MNRPGRFLTAWLASLLATVVTLAAARPPNIVFILADDLGIRDLGCYGRRDHHTPRLDRLAAEGTRFASAYCAQPICSPSRAAILTGKAPARLHLTTYLPGRPDSPAQRLLHPVIRQELPLAELTLAERLRAAGYVSACIGKWHLGGTGFEPRDQGFDVFHPGRANTPPSATEGGKGEYDLTAAAERFIEANRTRPFFLYLAHNSPHIPYAAATNRVARQSGAYEPVYAAVIETLDDAVGRLLDRIEALGLVNETLVVFTSDNGGLHVPEGPHARITSNAPFRAGKGFLYEGGLRIPLIVRWPGHVPAGRVVDAPVINTDWVPTLLASAGLPQPRDLDGVNLLPLLTRRGAPPSRRFYWHFPHYTNQGSRPGGAVRDGRWKLVERYDDGVIELFDLAHDPGEAHDLSRAQPRVTRRLAAALAAWRTSVGAQSNRPNPAFDPARFQELYVNVDASRYDGPTAGAAGEARMLAWRKAMNAAVEALPAGDRPKSRTEGKPGPPAPQP